MKWIIIAVVAVIVVGGGAGAYYLLNKNDDSSSSANNAAVTNSSSKSSIADLLSGGKSATCNYSITKDGNTTDGTVYVAANKKLYGVFASTVNGNATETYIIRDGDTQYMWTKGSTTGYKTNVTASNNSTDSSSSSQTSQSVDTSKKYDFKCRSWTVDNSKFTPPSDVTFSDLSAQPSTDTAKAAVCNALTGTAKTACLNATNQ